MLTRLILFCAAVSFEESQMPGPDVSITSLPASALALPARWGKIRSEAKQKKKKKKLMRAQSESPLASDELLWWRMA
jgi:hypothetical protein